MQFIDIKDYLDNAPEDNSEDLIGIPVWDVRCNKIKIIKYYLPINTICNKK